MIRYSDEIEMSAVMNAAERLCAAARTAPKTQGRDHIKTCVVTDGDIEKLACEMERLGEKFNYGFFLRDAGNVRSSAAVVIIGTTEAKHGLNGGCGYCHFADCVECAEKNGCCVFDMIDLGIAIGSAVSAAADLRCDNRVMFSVGRAAAEMKLLGEDVKAVIGVPLSLSGKSPYYDRKQ